jgi:hypothetical protein
MGDNVDELAKWHKQYGTKFDMGTVYTMIAGLLNVLVIYDALAGPAASSEESEQERPPPDESS